MPLPRMVTLNVLLDAMKAPPFSAKAPTRPSEKLCRPKIASQGNRSKSPSSIIFLAPALPISSAGWKTKFTVPLKMRVRDKCQAAASSIVVCPSCPHACIRPSWVDLWANVLSSFSGRASISARRPIARLPSPLLSTPTTPVPAMPRCTSMPHSSSRRATISEVRCSSKPSSGCAWMSRRIWTKRLASRKSSTSFMEIDVR